MATNYTRPYRSKRHPPCDQCRRKKLRCQADAGTICQRCQRTNTLCSFSQYQPVESSPSTALPTPAPAVISDSPFSPIDPLSFIPESTPGRFGQAIQTLDGLSGVSSQVIGASGESDPWLLQHCRFDDHGFLPFHRVHFRNAGGVPLEEKIPVHFLVTAEQLYDTSKEATRFPKRASIRDELELLVPPECGQRLVALYEHLFPGMKNNRKH